MGILAALLLFAASNVTPNAAASVPSSIPAATGTALDGHTVTLPRDLNAPATILILGFTQRSADTTTAWEKPIRSNLATPSIHYYDMPFLEEVPAFIRPLVLRSIRKQVPDVLKPRFVPLTSGESTWKQLTHFSASSAPDAAYVLLVDHTGTVRWQTHDPFTPARFQELSTAARTLAAESGQPQSTVHP